MNNTESATTAKGAAPTMYSANGDCICGRRHDTRSIDMDVPLLPMTSRTLDLSHDPVQVLESRRGMRVKVLYGDVWLTEQGDHRDHFLGSGEEVALDSKHRTVIESLGPAWIEISEPTDRSRWRRWLDSIRLQPLVTRSRTALSYS
jgi:hypothetical protein